MKVSRLRISKRAKAQRMSASDQSLMKVRDAFGLFWSKASMAKIIEARMTGM